ncbi:hypothetical protein TRFO_20770 [Tritrichomonas foetus]|uniref:Uncharacterized protein n=1 Tax=Tritrichomonas foetus TaxID=1144522 RepID=A0A1J4KFX3_9EUKA|nr:hypothetical protein TRFO_20770 [Tritrichomonas foetus]|eukprot:OHT10115.1 hypothetical protein TRFO_20770 [Tritrichomonas foetus]
MHEENIVFLTEQANRDDTIVDLRGQVIVLEERNQEIREQNQGLREEVEETQHEHKHVKARQEELTRKIVKAFDQLLIKDLKLMN